MGDKDLIQRTKLKRQKFTEEEVRVPVQIFQDVPLQDFPDSSKISLSSESPPQDSPSLEQEGSAVRGKRDSRV